MMALRRSREILRLLKKCKNNSKMTPNFSGVFANGVLKIAQIYAISKIYLTFI